ncbi:MAG: site-2 protease family protein [Dongiaceae bacterium]
MFARTMDLFEIFGFQVRVDITWLFLAALITWSLATGYFPQIEPGLAARTYWWMGIAGMIGLFLSIVFHELSHSLVARRFGLPIRGITLFLFGGVAEMEQEPVSPKAEFLMAIAGPISSFLLAGTFYLLAAAAGDALPHPVVDVLGYLALLNFILAAFNLLPAFPLDGGRMLRAVLWHRKGSSRDATRIAARIGSHFGVALIVLGILNAIGGNLVGGFWLGLIGLFLRSSALAHMQESALRHSLEGERVERYMTAPPVTVPPTLTLRELVDRYIYRERHEAYPVSDSSGRPLGIVSVHDVRAQPREEWGRITVGQVMTESGPGNTIDADADAVRALSTMQKNGHGRLLVTRGSQLVGIVALKDLLRLLSLRMDLEGDA